MEDAHASQRPAYQHQVREASRSYNPVKQTQNFSVAYCTRLVILMQYVAGYCIARGQLDVQHAACNSVAICCVNMLREFGRSQHH